MERADAKTLVVARPRYPWFCCAPRVTDLQPATCRAEFLEVANRHILASDHDGWIYAAIARTHRQLRDNLALGVNCVSIPYT
jgi:hypothetical protein